MNTRDAALLRRWSEHRDAEAFNDLVSHYADMVYATCKRTLGNSSDAEELTQECFLKLATSPDRIRTSLGGWLHSAATSLSINRLRSDARRRKREEIAVAEAPSTAEPIWDDLQRHVDEAIAELPEDLREPLIRHFLQRETHDQIAQDLGVTRWTVSRRIASGIERVHKRLTKGGIALTAAALTTLATERLVEAAPASLKASLGRLSLSAVPQSVAVGATGISLMTKILAAVVLVAIACAGAVTAYHRASPPAPSRDASAPLANKGAGTPEAAAAITKTIAPDPTTTRAKNSPRKMGVPPCVAGRVLNPTGDPIVGAKVEVWGRRAWEESYGYVPNILGTDSADADGRFAVNRLAVDKTLVLVIRHPDHATYTELRRPERKSDFIDEGKEYRLDPAFPVTGRVLDEEGRPVSDAEVVLWNAWPQRLNDPKAAGADPCVFNDFGALDAVKSDGDGRFVFANLGQGYMALGISARKAGYGVVLAPGDPAEELPPDKLGWRGSKGVFVVNGKERNVTLRPAVAVSGRVLDDATGQAVEGATVGVDGITDSEYYHQGTVSGPDGAYRFDSLPRGSDKWITAFKGDLVGGKYALDLSGGQAVEALDFHLVPGAVLEGIIYDSATGRPTNSTGVSMMEMKKGGQSRGSGKPDEGGHYRVDRLHASDYTLFVSAQFALDLAHHPAARVYELPLTIEMGKVVRQDLYIVDRSKTEENGSSQTLQVFVNDSRGVRVPAAEVRLLNSLHKGATDASGMVEFRGVDASRYTVYAFDPATRACGWREVTTNSSAPATVEVTVDALACGVSGRVLHSTGEPPARPLKVSAMLAGLIVGEVDTALDGGFALPALPPGELKVWVEDPEGYYLCALPLLELELAPGEERADLKLAVTEMKQRVAGVVVRPNGKPAVGQALELEGTSVRRRTATDGEGRFVFDHVAGQYLTLKVGEAFGTEWLSRTVSAGEEQLRLTLESSGTLKARLLLTEEQREQAEARTVSVGSSHLQVHVIGAMGFDEWRALKSTDVDLRLQPDAYSIEFRIMGEPTSMLTVDNVEIATGKITDLGERTLEVYSP